MERTRRNLEDGMIERGQSPARARELTDRIFDRAEPIIIENESNEKSTRLTLTIKHADRRALIELAEREGVPMGKAATAALREGIKAVHAMEAAAKKL